MVEPTPLKKYATVQIGSFHQGSGVKKKNMWNHHPGFVFYITQVENTPSLVVGCCGGGGVYVSNLSTKNTFIITKNSPSCSILPATNSSHLQINGWKMKFLLGFCLFSGVMLILGRVSPWKSWWFSNISQIGSFPQVGMNISFETT